MSRCEIRGFPTMRTRRLRSVDMYKMFLYCRHAPEQLLEMRIESSSLASALSCIPILATAEVWQAMDDEDCSSANWNSTPIPNIQGGKQ